MKPKNNQSSIRDYMRAKGEAGCVHLVDNAYWHITGGRLKPADVQNFLSEDDLRLLATRLAGLKALANNSNPKPKA